MASFFKIHVLPIVMYSVAYVIGLFYGIIILFNWLLKIIQDRSLDYFRVRTREIPPECLNDPELGNHVYVQLMNIKVHYVEKGDKNKPLILFLHGFPEFWYSWRYQIKDLSKDYWTVAVDLRGYGDTEKPKGTRHYHMEYLLQDLQELIEALGKDKCILVAHDWGGIIAFYFIHNYPQLIDSYAILCSGHPKAFLEVILSNLRQFRKSWYVFFYQLPFLPELSLLLKDMFFFERIFSTTKQINEQDIEAYKYTFGQPGSLSSAVNYYRKNIVLYYNLLKEHVSDDFKWPKGLFLYADNDDFIDFNVAESTTKYVNNIKIERIKGASHFLQQDEPEKVNKCIRNFLDEK